MHVIINNADKRIGEIALSNQALDKVLFDFNPTSNGRVATIKTLHAALIETMLDLQAAEDVTPAQKRVAAMAISDLEKVQMLCVKALFAKA